MGFTKARITALHEAMLAAGLESPYAEWLEQLGAGDAAATRATRITTRVRVRASTSRCATTRCAPTPPRSTRTASWFPVPLEIQQKAWPTEDYELARSLVDSPTSPRTTCSPGSGR